VLCLAEGEGRNAVYLAQQGYEVTAIDSSEVGLQKAQKLANEKGVKIETIVEDLAHYVIDAEKWQGIVSIFCHLPPALRQKVHHQVSTGLCFGGVFLLEAYHPNQLNFKTGGPPTAELMVTLDDLENELQGLAFEQACYRERLVNEGILHHGMGAVVWALKL